MSFTVGGTSRCTTNRALYLIVCSSDKYWCVSVTYISVCGKVCVCLGDCGLPLARFQVEFTLLFSPHHVNKGGVQKTTPQVTRYKPHTAIESLRRRRLGKAHPGYVWTCGSSMGTLDGAASTPWEGLCRWTPAPLGCRNLGSHVSFIVGYCQEESHVNRRGIEDHSSRSVCPWLHERNVLSESWRLQETSTLESRVWEHHGTWDSGNMVRVFVCVWLSDSCSITGTASLCE